MPKSNSSALPRWCAVFTLLISGCASTPTPPAVEEDGKGIWRRVESEHFILESNGANERNSYRIAAEFEILWKAFSKVPVLGLRPPNVKPLVVVLRDDSEFQYLAGAGTQGYFVHESAIGPMIVLPPHSVSYRETVVKHELTHFICSDFIPKAPLWLSEGLAQVMETASYDTRSGEVIFGAHSPGRVDGASSSLSSERFMGDWPERSTVLEMHYYYGRSWLLVHYLIDNELQPFLNFLVRLSKGEEWRMAWQREQLPRFDEIDELIEDYHDRGRYGLWRSIAYAPQVNLYKSIPVSTSDALALRSVLIECSSSPDREQGQSDENAKQDLESALAADPQGARAQRVASAPKKAKE